MKRKFLNIILAMTILTSACGSSPDVSKADASPEIYSSEADELNEKTEVFTQEDTKEDSLKEALEASLQTSADMMERDDSQVQDTKDDENFEDITENESDLSSSLPEDTEQNTETAPGDKADGQSVNADKNTSEEAGKADLKKDFRSALCEVVRDERKVFYTSSKEECLLSEIIGNGKISKYVVLDADYYSRGDNPQPDLLLDLEREGQKVRLLLTLNSTGDKIFAAELDISHMNIVYTNGVFSEREKYNGSVIDKMFDEISSYDYEGSYDGLTEVEWKDYSEKSVCEDIQNYVCN
jgi:hypothetical protein